MVGAGSYDSDRSLLARNISCHSFRRLRFAVAILGSLVTRCRRCGWRACQAHCCAIVGCLYIRFVRHLLTFSWVCGRRSRYGIVCSVPHRLDRMVGVGIVARITQSVLPRAY